MSHLNLGQVEQTFAQQHCVEDPVGSLGVLLQPWLVLQSGVDSEDFFQVLVFTKDLKLLLKLIDFVFAVDILWHFTDLVRNLEQFPAGQRAHLLENWDEVFISC